MHAAPTPVPVPAPSPGPHRTTPPASTGKGAPPAAGQTLPDGSKVEVRKLGEQHYVARIVHDGQVLGSVEADGRDAGLDANGVYIVLGTGGEISAHE